MLTIITEEIDDLTIVRGFGRPSVDAAASKPIIAAEIKKTAEYSNCLKIGKESKSLIIKARKQISNKAKKLKPTKEKSVNAQLLETQEYKNFMGVKVGCYAKIREAHQIVQDKCLEILKLKAVYFTPKAGEKIISEEEAAPLQTQFKALSKKILMTLGGIELPDQRGEKFWIQDEDGVWESGLVKRLDEILSEESVLDTELTIEDKAEIQEQEEEQRIDDLDEEERREEVKSKTNQLRRQAAIMRSELEIEGADTAAALEEAQNWYKAQMAELEEKYALTKNTL